MKKVMKALGLTVLFLLVVLDGIAAVLGLVVFGESHPIIAVSIGLGCIFAMVFPIAYMSVVE